MVLARVNGEPVTQAEVHRLLLNPAARAELQQELGIRERDARALQRLAVDKLVAHRLLLQEARRRNFTVSNAEFDRALVKLRRRFDDLKQFGAWMDARGLNDRSLLDTIRQELLIIRATQVLFDGVTVSEDEVRAYYEAHKPALKTAGAVRLQMIAVHDEAAAEAIVQAAKGGADFGKLARESSLGLRAARGGDTEWVRRDGLPALLREALSAAKVGQIIGPLPASGGFRIVRLVAERPGITRSLAEVRPSIVARLLEDKRKTVFAAWRKEQEKLAKVEVLN